MASQSTRRALGLALILCFVATTVVVLTLREFRSVDRLVAPGVESLVEGLRDGSPEETDAAFDRAALVFGEALAHEPFDPYPAFLLSTLEKLRKGAALPPQPTLFERSLLLLSENRLDEARALVRERPEELRSEADRLLLRLLDDISDTAL